MYPFSVSDCPSPGRGLLYMFIGELTSKLALVLLTLLCASKHHFEDCSGIVNPIKCKQRIQGWLLVILHSKPRGWVINIDFIKNIVRLNNKRYIFCYCIFNYDKNLLFNLYFTYMSFIIIIITNFVLVIYCHFCQKCLEVVKELCSVQFPISIYTNIGKYTITIT